MVFTVLTSSTLNQTEFESAVSNDIFVIRRNENDRTLSSWVPVGGSLLCLVKCPKRFSTRVCRQLNHSSPNDLT
jgi:hypothetical protein